MGNDIQTLTTYKLLTPWQDGEDPRRGVRIAATFPLRELKHKPYMISGDERFGFDPNAFVRRPIEETGVSHVWEPVATKVAEGGRCFVTQSVRFEGQVPKPEREANRKARQVIWNMWKRFAPSLDQVLSHSDKEQAAEVVDNIDLVRQLEDSFRDLQHVPLDPILSEPERRAQRFPGSG